MYRHATRSVALAFCALFLFIAHVSAASSQAVYLSPPTVFSILHEGDKIGRHTVSYRRDGDVLHVDIAIDIEMRVLFIPIFKYRHRNSEVWRGGRLISMKTETDDNGTEYWVMARATDTGLVVETDDTSFIAPADIMPTSYWSKNIVDTSVLLDTQHGRLVEVSISPENLQHVATAKGTVEAKRFNILGDLSLSLWYTPAGRWVKTSFSVRGVEIEYQLQDKALRTSERPGH
jgi:hypothetical protein